MSPNGAERRRLVPSNGVADPPEAPSSCAFAAFLGGASLRVCGHTQFGLLRRSSVIAFFRDKSGPDRVSGLENMADFHAFALRRGKSCHLQNR
jgi:hypothetical protein